MIDNQTNKMWIWFLDNKHKGDILSAVKGLCADMQQAEITDHKLSKLLRLASCPSSPIGEKENAAKMAFKFMIPYFN